MRATCSDSNLDTSWERVTSLSSSSMSKSYRGVPRGGVRIATPAVRRCNPRVARLYLNFITLFVFACCVFLFWSSLTKVHVLRSGDIRHHVGQEEDIGLAEAPGRERFPNPGHPLINAHAQREEGKTPARGRKKGRLAPLGKRYAYEQEKVLALSLPKAVFFKPMNIAIGCAITSRGVANPDVSGIDWPTAVRELPIFHELLPSFCKTATDGYRYRFYLAYDHDDPWLSEKDARRAFADVFFEMTDNLCDTETQQVNVDLKFTACNHSGSPAWAQNDAMMEAYNDDVTMTYFYRVNDDTVLSTPGWTEAYIQILNQFDPPNIGVVGPNFKTNGTSNPHILTYDFVHRTHIDIFNFYYPRELKDWFADDWISHVHQPRAVRLRDVHVMHTKVLKTRYKNSPGKVELLDGLIQEGRERIQHWLNKPPGKRKKTKYPPPKRG